MLRARVQILRPTVNGRIGCLEKAGSESECLYHMIQALSHFEGYWYLGLKRGREEAKAPLQQIYII